MRYLAAELKDTFLDWEPSRHLVWMLVIQLEKLVPGEILLRKKKVATKKAARLLFVEEVTGRRVSSFKQLLPGEVVRIKRWLDGNGPSPSDEKSERDKAINRAEREKEVVAFWNQNKEKVWSRVL